jgi:hypothetical protein
LDAGAQIRGQRHSALDFGGVPGAVELHQALKLRQEGQPTTAFAVDDSLHHLSRSVLIQHSVYETPTEQSLGFTLGLSGRLHAGLFTQQFSTLKFAKLQCKMKTAKCKIQNG